MTSFILGLVDVGGGEEYGLLKLLEIFWLRQRAQYLSSQASAEFRVEEPGVSGAMYI